MNQEHAETLAKRFPPGNFPITSISRQDLEMFLCDNDRMDLAVLVKHFTDDDMQQLANDMANDYLEQLFWTQVEILPMDKLKELREKHKCKHDSVPAVCPDCSICAKCKKRFTCEYSTYDPQECVPGPLEEPYNETTCEEIEEGDPIPKED